MSLESGERQVAPTIAGIRADHVERYKWAASFAVMGDHVLDAACGVGYGVWLFAQKGCRARGIDNDEETIAFARNHYTQGVIESRFFLEDLEQPQPFWSKYDIVTCFETIEHLDEPRPWLLAIDAFRMFASVPNEAVFPHRTLLNKSFHRRHYTRTEFEQLLNECGWMVRGWYTQYGATGEAAVVREGYGGSTIIADCYRIGVPQ